MAIIKLEGADFSANYIEKITLEYDSLTDSIIAASSLVLTSGQKNALDLLIKTLKNNGSLAMMDYLFIPIVMGALSEALINIADESLAVADTPNPTYWAIESNKGLYNANPVYDVSAHTQISVNTDWTQGDFHFLAVNSEALTSNLDAVAFGDQDNVSNLNLRFSNTSTKLYASTSATLAGNTLSDNIASITNAYKELSTIGLYGLNLDNLSDFKIVDKSAIITTPYTTPVTSYPNLASGYGNLSGTYPSSFAQKPHAIISIGKALTESQITSYSDAVDNLMSEFDL